MTSPEIHAAILDALADIAPEVDPASLRNDLDLRQQVDLDSMDMLNLVVGVHERTGVDIPEAEYPRLTTLDAIATFVESALRSPARAPDA
jgi:acyl carrier protein